jgi:hypothetical protein
MRQEFPNTIFLPDRARLAMNCLKGLLNPAKDDLPYCLVDLTGSPPRMAHTQFDYSDHTARVLDALLLAKAMTGCREAEAESDRLVKLLNTGFGPDGLHYTPDNPWSFRHANTHYQRSVINALITRIQVDKSEEAATQLRALLKGLDSISVKRDGFAYFPSVEYLPDGWPRNDWKILSWGVDPANTNGRLIFGLVRAAELLDDPDAAELAAAYARHVMDHSSAFSADGSFATGMEFREGHFHSRAVTMLGVIRLGHSLGDARAIEWGRRVFDRAKQYGTASGWFPERIVRSRAHGCETCAIVDMLEAAIYLARSGFPEYWSDAERYLRNQLLESQLIRIDWLEDHDGEAGANEYETTDHVARRSLGGFAGWSQPSDFVSKVMHEWDLYTCCCAQGVRGLFSAWSHAVDVDERVVRVNLLINHHGEAATVRSWLPNQGRIEVDLRKSAEIHVRIPPWVDHRSIRATSNGEPAVLSMVNPHFWRTTRLAAGSSLVVEFPMKSATTTETVLDAPYAFSWRGDSVVDVAPGGTVAPLYQRSHYCDESVANIERDVPHVNFSL